MPFIAQTAVGKRESLSVFGGDYDTEDGTDVRDYIHVVDLADAHVKAIKYLGRAALAAPSDEVRAETKPLVVNIGTGTGYSVLDMVKAFEKASNKHISYKIEERRSGDIAKCFADAAYAKEVLNWEATKTMDEMCEDSWKWQMNNPNGYSIKKNICI